MEEKEWTLLSRGERENILTQIGIKKEAVDRNAKVNFDFLDEDVKQALAGTKLTVKDVVTRKDVRRIEREYMKGAVNIEDFKRGCRVAGGELEEKKRTLVCELNEDEKIVMDNKGRWVKTYGFVGYQVSLRTWSVPTKIIVDEEDKSMEIILISGKSILAGLRIQTTFRLPQKPSWEVSLIIDDPKEMLPEFNFTAGNRK